VSHIIDILKGLRDRYEVHHRVTITDDALVAAVGLADRYIKDRVLPGTAIDLIDEAGARQQITLKPPPDFHELDQQIAEFRRDKESAIDAQDFEKAASLRDKEKGLLSERASRQRDWQFGGEDVIAEINEEQIAEVLADLLGGEEIVAVSMESSHITRGQRLLATIDLFQESADMW
jgi:ATP-dependent Clp protease ATP-binding subunit ClpC